MSVLSIESSGKSNAGVIPARRRLERIPEKMFISLRHCFELRAKSAEFNVYWSGDILKRIVQAFLDLTSLQEPLHNNQQFLF